MQDFLVIIRYVLFLCTRDAIVVIHQADGRRQLLDAFNHLQSCHWQRGIFGQQTALRCPLTNDLQKPRGIPLKELELGTRSEVSRPEGVAGIGIWEKVVGFLRIMHLVLAVVRRILL